MNNSRVDKSIKFSNYTSSISYFKTSLPDVKAKTKSFINGIVTINFENELCNSSLDVTVIIPPS